MNIIELIFNEYFYLRQSIPIFLYIFYIHFRDVNYPIIGYLVKTVLVATGFLTTCFIMGFILNIPFSVLIPFNWTYQGVIHWGIFFFFFFYISTRKNINSLASFTLATLASVGGGWLYEIPIFNLEYVKSIFFTRYSIFYLNGQIICLLFLGYEIIKRGFKPNILICATLTLFMAFSISLFLDQDFYRTGLGLLSIKWFYRIPASLFLISLLSGMKKQDDMTEIPLEELSSIPSATKEAIP